MKPATLNRRSILRRGAMAAGAALALPALAPKLEASASASQAEPSARISIRIIVVDSLTEAERIREELKKGADFGTLASKVSIDPTGKQGGSLGKIDPSKLRPDLREALRVVAPGELSTVVKTSEGYAILMVDREDRPLAMGEYTTSLLALTGPGAIHYGPNVDGFGEVYALFTRSPEKPRDFNLVLKPVTAAQIHRQPPTTPRPSRPYRRGFCSASFTHFRAPWKGRLSSGISAMNWRKPSIPSSSSTLMKFSESRTCTNPKWTTAFITTRVSVAFFPSFLLCVMPGLKILKRPRNIS